jgi:hypothetical protein
MSAILKLLEAKSILEDFFEKEIKSLDLNQDSRKLHMILTDGIEIYIIYNNHGQYGYNILFSNLDLDRCRFDNYDDRWDVDSRPHHFHPRKKIEVESSKMTGDPKNDIPKLCKMLQSGELHKID